jgi:hypothetical protein
MVRRAGITDYIKIQGGRPNITQDEGGIYHIRHDYRDDRPEVTTHISPAERGTVIINDVEYDVANLFQFEGAPCEKQSQTRGGEGYNRNGAEQNRGRRR